jgi:hypothetical protein
MIRKGKMFNEGLVLDGRLLPDVSNSVRTNRNEAIVIANAIAPLISI